MASFMDPDIDREKLERMLGLDRPIYVQYGRWLGGIFLHGTLGDSLLGAWRVEEKILARLPATLQLGVMAIVIGLLIGLPVGIYSAMRRNTAADYVGRSVAIIGLATPNFWLATLILTFPGGRGRHRDGDRDRRVLLIGLPVGIYSGDAPQYEPPTTSVVTLIGRCRS